MSGFYGIFINETHQLKENYKHFFSNSFNNIISEEYKYKNFVYGRSTINKFTNDRALFENDKYIIGFEDYWDCLYEIIIQTSDA